MSLTEASFSHEISQFKSVFLIFPANDLGKAAVKLMTALIDQILDNFGPALVRAKRSAESHNERDYLDVLVTCVGAVMDRQMCRKRITCQTGKVMQKMPGMATYMSIADALVMPEYMHKSDWYNNTNGKNKHKHSYL